MGQVIAALERRLERETQPLIHWLFLLRGLRERRTFTWGTWTGCIITAQPGRDPV
jgi:hypothetical protein